MSDLKPNGYIELDRRFSDFEDSEASEEAAYRQYFANFTTGGLTWEKLYSYPCVVVLAEAGSGKTWELKAKTQRLRDDGQDSFFLPLERLAAQSLEDCLSFEDRVRFTQWLNGNRTAHFFLDAVDEAKLSSRRALETALSNFVKGLSEEPSRRIKVVLTSRLVGWRHKDDQDLLRDVLNLPLKIEVNSDRDEGGQEIDDDDEGGFPEALVDGEQAEEFQNSVRVVTLNTLSYDQIRLVAEEEIGAQVEDFMTAIEVADAWGFARRPQDVIRLARYWQAKGNLGTLTELLEFDISSRLDETDEDRMKESGLTKQALRNGAESLAAAVVLGKSLTIQIENDHEMHRQHDAVLPSRELPSWTDKDRKDLLSRAIFDPASFGRIRFHHRSTAEYLAACWVDKLLVSRELTTTEADGLLFGRSLGQEVLIPSRAALACWLACGDEVWNKRILNRLLQISPTALLEHSDGTRLSLEARKSMLNQAMAHAAEEGSVLNSGANDQLKRLASPDIAPEIAKLLTDKAVSTEGRILLVRLVREGKLSSCIDPLIMRILGGASGSDEQVYGISAVAKAGSDAEKRTLLNHYLGQDQISHRHSYVLIREFYPDCMDAREFVEVASLCANPRRITAPDFPYEAREAIQDRMPDDHLDEMLSGLINLMHARPGVTVKDGGKSSLISSKNLWLNPLLWAVVDRAFRSRQCDNFTDKIVEAITLIGIAEKLDHSSESRKSKFDEISHSWPKTRRAFAWYHLNILALRKPNEIPSVHNVFDYYCPLSLAERDLEWLFADLQKNNSLPHRKIALNAANTIFWYCRAHPSKRAEVWTRVKDDGELRSYFRQLFPNRLKVFVAQIKGKVNHYIRWGYESDLRRVRKHYNRIWNFYYLSKRRGKIRSGESVGDLWHLFHVAHSSRRASAQEGVQRVERRYGKKISLAYRQGCKQLWKNFTPELPHEKEERNSVDGRISIGLNGIQLDIDDGLEFATISAFEAKNAVRCAIENLNSFPSWFGNLSAAHPQTSQAEILDCLRADFEFDGTDKHGSGLAYKLFNSPPNVWKLIAQDIRQLLQNGEPVSSEVLLCCVGVALRGNPTLKSDITKIARNHALALFPDNRLAPQWFIVWVWLDAGSAISWLENVSNSSPECVDDFLLMLGDQLDRDNLHYTPTEDPPSYHSVDIMRRMLTLMYRHIRPVDDIDRVGTGTYSPGPRDHAQNLRHSLLSRLAKEQGPEAFSALIKLSETPELKDHRAFILQQAANRRLLDAEPEKWMPGDSHLFAEKRYLPIRSGHDLYVVVKRRFDLMKDDIQDADFRRQEGLPLDGDEERLQVWAAHYLQERSEGRYEVLREIEVADHKMPDIRFVAPPYSPVSVEIKWADDWSYNELIEALVDQLVGKYMRARRSRHGVLLVCSRGKKKSWRPSKGLSFSFEELIQKLNNVADGALNDRWDVDGLSVVGIKF